MGSWGAGSFIFRELGNTGNYLRGTGEHAHTFGVLGSTAKKNEDFFRDLGRSKIILKDHGREHSPPPPPHGGISQV